MKSVNNFVWNHTRYFDNNIIRTCVSSSAIDYAMRSTRRLIIISVRSVIWESARMSVREYLHKLNSDK